MTILQIPDSELTYCHWPRRGLGAPYADLVTRGIKPKYRQRAFLGWLTQAPRTVLDLARLEGISIECAHSTLGLMKRDGLVSPERTRQGTRKVYRIVEEQPA